MVRTSRPAPDQGRSVGGVWQMRYADKGQACRWITVAKSGTLHNAIDDPGNYRKSAQVQGKEVADRRFAHAPNAGVNEFCAFPRVCMAPVSAGAVRTGIPPDSR